VSLDERRAKFKANLWNRPNAEERTLGLNTEEDEDEPSTPLQFQVPQLPFLKDGVNKQVKLTSRGSSSKQDKMLDKYEKLYSEKAQQKTETDVEEVWFSVSSFNPRLFERPLTPKL
jgi:hypothetical protein